MYRHLDTAPHKHTLTPPSNNNKQISTCTPPTRAWTSASPTSLRWARPSPSSSSSAASTRCVVVVVCVWGGGRARVCVDVCVCVSVCVMCVCVSVALASIVGHRGWLGCYVAGCVLDIHPAPSLHLYLHHTPPPSPLLSFVPIHIHVHHSLPFLFFPLIIRRCTTTSSSPAACASSTSSTPTTPVLRQVFFFIFLMCRDRQTDRDFLSFVLSQRSPRTFFFPAPPQSSHAVASLNQPTKTQPKIFSSTHLSIIIPLHTHTHTHARTQWRTASSRSSPHRNTTLKPTSSPHGRASYGCTTRLVD
jgi:hypothetical protein